MVFKADMEQAEFLSIDYWFYAYGGIKSFEGLGHLGRGLVAGGSRCR